MTDRQTDRETDRQTKILRDRQTDERKDITRLTQDLEYIPIGVYILGKPNNQTILGL